MPETFALLPIVWYLNSVLALSLAESLNNLRLVYLLKIKIDGTTKIAIEFKEKCTKSALHIEMINTISTSYDFDKNPF